MRTTSLLLTLVDHLFTAPVITVAMAKKVMKLSYPAALNGIQKLVAAGLLSEVEPHSTPTRFVAKEILKAVNAEPTRR